MSNVISASCCAEGRCVFAGVAPISPMPALPIALHLARHADTAWSEVIRPWLEAAHGRLTRSYVIVPTRGQAHGLKQRCVEERLPLLGVEFLSPGLARKKWLPLVGSKPTLGRELLLFELRAAIALRLEKIPATAPEWGFWKSLQSDAERALDDFDQLLKAGFAATDHPIGPLAELLTELSARVNELGYEFGPSQSEAAALASANGNARRLGGRVLVYGLSAEGWGEFFNVAAFVRRCEEIAVVLPEPEFRGQRGLDESWIEVWQALLGVDAVPIDAPHPSQNCEYVAAPWLESRDFESRPAASADGESPRILIGRTRADEMRLVAAEIRRLLNGGATEIGVIFPRACGSHLQLAELLAAAAIPFVDLLEAAGAPPLEAQIQQALLGFHQRGGRLEDALELWPLLRAAGMTEVSVATARGICERIFDEHQTHFAAKYVDVLSESKRAEWKEVGRVIRRLLPAWPERLTLAAGLREFEAMCQRLSLAPPTNWGALAALALGETRELPLQEVLAAIASFLPTAAPLATLGERGGFARVTLTTRRRAEGLSWSHLIFVQSNAGVWPERHESSGWLTDQHRAELNQRSRFSLGLFTSDDRMWLQKRSYAALARDTREQVIFSAAVFEDTEPELNLSPNSWLERLLWEAARDEPKRWDLQARFEQSARTVPVRTDSREIGNFLEIWQNRRDPARPFDEFFLSADPTGVRPNKLPARLIERGIGDPAELWFGAVLGLGQVDWRPLARVRRRSLGQIAHRVLARSLRGDPAGGVFFEKPSIERARAQLRDELGRVQALWPKDRLWDSFGLELVQICTALLENLYGLATGRFIATELSLPAGATVPIGADRDRLSVYGRVDVVFLDRPEWAGAQVDIVDFKTGNDPLLSAERMARDGSSLQLGIYLGAAMSLGARAGRIWMLKPEVGGVAHLEMHELPQALSALEQIGKHLDSGRYGALTRDRSEHAPEGLRWPLASTPISEVVLERKFEITFGAELEGGSDE